MSASAVEYQRREEAQQLQDTSAKWDKTNDEAFGRWYSKNEYGERVRIGRQSPTFEQVKHFERSDGEQAVALASEFFGNPLDWQTYALGVLLARDKRDKYLFHTAGITLPRQNGKSWIVRARCFYGLITTGEKILYTCQHGDTADEMFKALAAVFEDEDNEELHELLNAVRKANGQQAIYLKNGGVFRCTTRTNSLARGKSYDVLIYDESQELTKAQQAASLPTISASAKHNTQTIYIGTPPDSKAPGEVLQPLHDRIHEGKAPDAAWLEWSAPNIEDPHNREWWYETNPSLGILIDETAIEGEADSFASDDFARERLGWWTPQVSAQAVIPKELWDSAAIDAIGTRYRRKVAMAVKFSPDGSHYALAGAKQNAKNEVAFELVEIGTTANGTKALAQALAERRFKAACVVIDGLNGADTLCDNMSEIAKMPRGYVIRSNTNNVINAATGLLDALKAGSVAHTTQTALDDSALNSTRRDIGNNGGWGFAATDGHDSCAIEACALALWGLRTSKRNPKRKQRMI